MSFRLRRHLHTARACVLTLCAATLVAAGAAVAEAPEVTTSLRANPALWTVHGSKGTVYLLGSIHVLPPETQWRTPKVDAALNAADVFVFEIPMDELQKTKIREFIKANGMLPPGVSLSTLLTDEVRKDYAAALKLTHISPDLLSPMRPWLALLMLESGIATQQHLSAENGLDRQVYAFARDRPRVRFRALETPEQQLRLLMPEDRSLEIQQFDAGLKEILNETLSVNDLVNAWARGDVNKINDLMNSGFKDNPRAEKTLFDDRNRAWTVALENMLKERHTYFVTVGAGHLAGPRGVPNLLRRDGYRVDGP
ncbi:MAG: TraB/GumN family protein [Alphaproteobacteria bacterium]|nr:TraB/GumN family protein [Alphaproteobacteria bacterium]